jgi:hypothetical protein
MENTVTNENFELLEEFKMIIPENFSLDKFCRENGPRFSNLDPCITEKNFSKPTHVFKAGEEKKLKIYRNIKKEVVRATDWISFIESQKGQFGSAQAAAMVLQELGKKFSMLPIGWVAFPDKLDALWNDPDGDISFTQICCFPAGKYYFMLGGAGPGTGYGENCRFAFFTD